MSDVKAKPKDKLAQASQHYESLRRELAALAPQVGFLLTGSVQSRFFECSRQNNCRCHDDMASRHGPYHYWTRKVKGKTVSVTLTDDQLAVVQEWIQNSRALERLLKKMRDESMRAIALTTGKTIEEIRGPRAR
jgi:hypothetical protein